MRNNTDIGNMSVTFKNVFRILNILDLALDEDEVPIEQISPKALKISENRWMHYLIMLQNAGYVDGVKVIDNLENRLEIDVSDISITLKGLEYLANNDTLRKVANIFVKTGLKVAEKTIPIP